MADEAYHHLTPIVMKNCSNDDSSNATLVNGFSHASCVHVPVSVYCMICCKNVISVHFEKIWKLTFRTHKGAIKL